MSRRRKSSPIEDLIAVAATIPWWISIPMAVGSYLLLHPLATRFTFEAQAVSSENTAYAAMFALLTTIGQYLIPAVFILGALTSVIQGVRDRKRLGLATGNDAARAVQEMDWREFESLVGQAFERQGYQVTRTGGDGPDGGVDLILTKGGETFLVQCKQWRAFRVGVPVVRELYGVMAAEGAAGGYVVTSGRFTEEAEAFAQGRNIRLINGPELQSLLGGLPPPQARSKSTAADAPARAVKASPVAETESSPPPICPRCSGPMVERTARRGEKAGETFWGCREYPACRGTRPMRP